MSSYFLDSSAIVKRYLPEIGPPWIRQRCDPATGATIVLAAITAVEVAAALAARHRATGGSAGRAYDNALALFLRHYDDEYAIIDLGRSIIAQAIALPQRHRLRGYDAVQLATALAADRALRAANLAPLSFIAADRDLLAAAREEGLAVDDPNLHR